MAITDPPKETPFFYEGTETVQRPWIRWFISLAGANAQVRTPTITGLPGDFGLAQAGQEVFLADYHHGLLWDGVKWVWGPNENGSGFYVLFENDPEGFGDLAWALCNGQTTDFLNSDGTTTAITLPNVTDPIYLKAGLESLSVEGASGGVTPVGVTTLPKDLNVNTIQITPAGAGTGVVHNLTNPHDHTSDPHTHATGDLELRRRQFKLWFRR